MTNSPKVSVCIPVYNAGDFLALAIASVLDQEFEDFELIIVDDFSTQPTEAIIQQFDDKRIRFRCNSHNLGLVDNWNRCLELTRGKYITILHQDDMMLPNNLFRKVAMLDANPTVGFVYSNIQQIDQTGQLIGGHWIDQLGVDSILPGQMLFKMVAVTGNPISCPSVVVRAECYERLGIFNKRLPFATDLEMWMRIAGDYDIGYLAHPLISQRVHPKQATARFQGTGRDYWDVLHALDIVFSRSLPLTHSNYARGCYRTLSLHSIQMARWKFRQGKIIDGLRYLTVSAISLFRIVVKTNTSVKVL